MVLDEGEAVDGLKEDVSAPGLKAKSGRGGGVGRRLLDSALKLLPELKWKSGSTVDGLWEVGKSTPNPIFGMSMAD
ncbi:hypothetical protein RRF57_000365 [Xylaria bambusicola]|uniref:Uncharacterized protein n=1 Tax=Xylaria bambusicola TaxID=326684 RepID=A0AAN7UNH2_9PEZI